MNVKQVIVMRHDLKMRKGKIAAQAAHASLGAVLQLMRNVLDGRGNLLYSKVWHEGDAAYEWLTGSFRKICVYVNSEEELLRIEAEAVAAGLNVKLITDNGLTEFAGVPTRTCLAIGPHEDYQIDEITGKLPLY